MLNVAFPWNNCKDFLVSQYMSLGGVPPGGIKFKKSEVYHLGRWMAK